MKKNTVIVLILLLVLTSAAARAAEIETLAQGVAAQIKAFFQDKGGITAAVTRLENQTSLNGTALERIYQLIYSQLISANDNQFFDFLVEFHDNTARFNLTRADDIQYLIYLKFIEEPGRIGAGIVIFSRRLDQVVAVKYIDAPITKAERNLLEVRQFGFTELGFSRLIEIDLQKNLMDVQSMEIDGKHHLLLFYPRHIEFYQVLGHGLEKQADFSINWPKPVFPVRHYEGKLTLFSIQERRYLAVGSNFSKQAMLFEFQDRTWRETTKIPFTPLADIIINGIRYLVGSSYETGKNCFQNRMFFLPLLESGFAATGILEKTAPGFYDCAFVCRQGELESVHFITLDFQHQAFAADLTTPMAALGKKGVSIANLDDSWLAITDYSSGSDLLFFCKLEQSQFKPVYENAISGEVLFLSTGFWQEKKGFWAYVRDLQEDHERFTLQFWSKKSE